MVGLSIAALGQLIAHNKAYKKRFGEETPKELAKRIAVLEAELLQLNAGLITRDGVRVTVGDRVWVLSSCNGPKRATVIPPATDYNLFGPIPVTHSFSTKKAAEERHRAKQ